MGKALSVIVPCYNEEENVAPLVERVASAIRGLGVEGEIILVDDASRDRTREMIEQAAARDPQVVGVFHERNRGIVGGWRSGLAAAQGEYVVTIDADLQYLPEDIPRLYREARAGNWDLVQGCRVFSGENNPLRHFLSVGLSFFLNLLFGMHLRDIKSGFILYRREVFADVLNHRRHYDSFQHFVTIAAHAKGYRIQQIPVLFDRRRAGQSFITQPVRFSLRVLKEIPTALREYRFGRGR